MTLARARTFLELSGADREARDIVNASGIKIDNDGDPGLGFARYIHTIVNISLIELAACIQGLL